MRRMFFSRYGISRASAVAAALLLAACSRTTEKPQVVPPVYVIQVGVGGDATQYTYSGDVRPRVESVLAFRVAGKLIERRVDVGATVKRGDTLARLDPQDLNLRSQGVAAQISAAELELSQRKDDVGRFRTLLERGFISQAEFDRHLNTVKIAQARVDELRSLEHTTRNQAEYAVLRTDDDGVVTAVEVERGQVVAAGQPVVRVAQLGEKDIVITVPENRLEEIKAAKSLQISLWANPEHSYQGQLREVSPLADPATRTYTAKVAVLNAPADMRLGMTARVQIKGARSSGIHVPTGALYRSGEKTAVWVVDPAQATVRLVPVVATALQGDQVNITSGLTGGETVVIAGANKLTAGQKVRPVSPTQ